MNTSETFQEPEPRVVPDTAANRLLYAAVRQNDSEAVFAAFEQGASPNACVIYPRFDMDTYEVLFDTEPFLLLFLIVPNPTIIYSLQDEKKNRLQAVAIFRQFLERGVNLTALDQRKDNPVTSALQLKNVDLVRMVLDKGGDPGALIGVPEWLLGNAVNYIFLITIKGEEEETLTILQLILETGADPNLYDCYGITPLHHASRLGLTEYAKTLLQYGANPALYTQPDENNNQGGLRVSYKATALMLATQSGNREIIAMLTEATDSLSAEEAVTTGNSVALKRHLDSGLNPNTKDAMGMPYIVLAAASGVPDVVQLLLEYKADIDARSQKGTGALRRAVMLGHTEVVHLLLRFGADPNATSGRENALQTPLTTAIRAAEVEIVAALLADARLDITAPGNHYALLQAVHSAGKAPPRPIGKSPQSMKRGDAVREAQGQIYDRVVKRFDIQKWGGSALCQAVTGEQFGIARDLIQRGADINAQDQEGKTVLMLAIERMGMNLFESSPYVLSGAVLSPTEKANYQKAANAQNEKGMAFLQLLLSKNPDLDLLSTSNNDGSGKSALALARYWKLPKVVTLLKQAGAKR
jgi:ankyrin repeat protein